MKNRKNIKRNKYWHRYNKKVQRIFWNIIYIFLFICILVAGGILYKNVLDINAEIENINDMTSYNENTEISGTSEPKTSDWNLLLVNPWNKLSDNFSVDLMSLNNGHAIDERVYPDLQAMMDDARAEGLSPIICSSYRSNDKQQTLFDNQVNKYLSEGYTLEDAEDMAKKWVAVPGTSEHQTGLAVDIVSFDYQILDENQKNTAEQRWLMENSYKYGFILRYPSDKTEITGINYEPWHYRYVGKKAAKEIYEQRICLEEYLDNMK